MFREMWRQKQQLSPECTEAILQTATCGVLAVSGDDGYPYAVPLSFVYAEGKLYFHSAKAGHKIDAIQRQPKASFCIIDQDQIVPDEYTTYYRSVIAFGQIRLLQTEEEKRHAITLLAKKYFPNDTVSHREESINHSYAPVLMLEMAIEHVTGKEAIELVRGQNA